MGKIIGKRLFLTLVLLFVLVLLPLKVSAATASSEKGLRTAVEDEEEDLVKLTKDITISSTLEIPAGRTLTLDLNGKTLSRGLTAYVKFTGSVIHVNRGAELTITDTSTNGNGIITGGFSNQGGGIKNDGAVTLLGGAITGNSATAGRSYTGGGVFNGSGATLRLQGGAILNNRADMGGGVYNFYGNVIIEPSVRQKTVDGVQKNVEYNVTISGNKANTGGAIWTWSEICLSGGAVLSGNDARGDIYLGDDSLCDINCGKLTFETPVSVAIAIERSWKNVTFTTGFGANNEGNPERYFVSGDPGARLFVSDVEAGELKLTRNTGKTVVEAYDHGKLIFTGEYGNPRDAWIASQNYWIQNEYYFTDYDMRGTIQRSLSLYPHYNDSKGFNDWYKQEVNYSSYAAYCERGDNNGYDWADEKLQASYSYWDGYLKDDYPVKITLGSDWKLDEQLLIWRFRNVILDLNGHSIDRGGKKAKKGNLFYLEEFAKLTILDSNPESDGYGDFKGGVIANGNGDDCGGGFILDDYSELDIRGGTICNCVTDEHGGAIYANEPHATIRLRDCTFDHCQTKDSGDDCNGGAIYAKNTLWVTMENVTFNSCYSEDNGGALYFTNRPGRVKMKNCTFTNNHALDYGGAIAIGDIDDKKLFLFEAVDCTFYNNQADDDGGAVIVSDNDDSQYHYPIIFRNCSFERNISGADGSAFELDDNSVSLINCTIKNNTAKHLGAVYVNDQRAVSVGGRTVIRGNTGQDIILDDDGDKTRVYSTGLTAGADINVNVIGSDNTIALKDIPQREVRYFTTYGKQRLEFRRTGEKTAGLVMSSVFGSGSIWVVIGIAAAAVIAAAAILAGRKKKNRRQENA